MFCGACGKQLPDASEFCSACGASQTGGGGGKAAVSAAGAMIAKAAKAEFAGFRPAEKLIVVGAAVAFISFFLPWASVMGQKVNGLGMMKVWGGVVLLLLIPIVSVFLLYRAKKSAVRQRIVLAGVQVLLGALVGPQLVFTMLLVPLANNVLAAGAWGLGLGFLGILAGALMMLADLGQRVTA